MADSPKISDLFYAAVFFCIVIGIVFVMFGDVAENNPGEINMTNMEQYNNTFNKFGEIESSTVALANNINGTVNAPGVFGFLDNLVGTGYNILTSFTQIFSFLIAIFAALQTSFGLPWYVTAGAGLLITGVIVFTILGALFQREI